MKRTNSTVRCGILAILLMSVTASAAPGSGQLWPSLASGIASLEATTVQVAPPELDCWGVDWYGRVWLWLSCPTSGATMRYTVDGSTPQYYSPVCEDLLIVAGTGTLKVRAFKTGMYPSQVLVIRIH
jgi:hypothetical protein